MGEVTWVGRATNRLAAARRRLARVVLRSGRDREVLPSHYESLVNVEPTAYPGYCPDCGRLNEPGYEFCANCGAVIPSQEPVDRRELSTIIES